MQFKRSCQNGYLTIYLSLIFGVILSLLLALVEGAAISAARLQSELVADIGLDSVFAEYHRELWEQYELFFIDESYGTSRGSLDRVQTHLEKYISYNTQPQTGQTFFYHHNFLELNSEYMEIDAVSFATDGQGEVLKAQAIDCMKDLYGVNYLTEIKNQLQQVTVNSLTTMDVEQVIRDKRKEFEESLEQTQQEESSEENYGEGVGGFSYQDILDCIDVIKGKGILYMTIEKPQGISAVVIEKEDYVSERMSEGNINQGCGLPSDINSPNGVDDEILFGEYLLSKCGSYTEPKDGSLLSYQVEYILFGRSSDVANLRVTAERLVGIRSAANFIYILTDQSKKLQAELVATAICLVIGVDAVEPLTYILLALWAYVEGIMDVKVLFAGEGVPLFKSKDNWRCDLSGILEGVFGNDEEVKESEGMLYEDYLRLLLLLTNKDNKVARAMDIMEMDIRHTMGNESFRMDRCIDYMKVTFGFEGSRGESFVFSRSMRYE